MVGHNISFNNVLMQIKKLCNHPCNLSDEDYSGFSADQIASQSGKMLVLKDMLQQFKASNDKVLIFSQLISSLEIIS